MGFTSTGIQYWDDTDGPYVNQASQEMAASLDTLVNASFASKALRDAAYASAIGLGRKGMTCYVTGYGQCFYDGNTRAGSSGWTWQSQRTFLYNTNNVSAYAITLGHNVIDTGVITLPSPRIVQVNAYCVLQADAAGILLTNWIYPLSGVSSMGTMTIVNQIMTAGGPGRQTAGVTWEGPSPAGALRIMWDLVAPFGGDATHGGSIMSGLFQVIDAGPTD